MRTSEISDWKFVSAEAHSNLLFGWSESPGVRMGLLSDYIMLATDYDCCSPDSVSAGIPNIPFTSSQCDSPSLDCISESVSHAHDVKDADDDGDGSPDKI